MCLKALKGAYKLPRPWLKYANARTTFIEWETAVASIDQAILEVEDVLKAEQVGHGESILLNDSEIRN